MSGLRAGGTCSGAYERAKRRDLVRGQLAALAQVKIAELDGTDRGADEPPDLEPCGEKKTSDLPVASLVEHDFEAGSAAGRLAETAHLHGERGLPFDHEPSPAHLFQILLAGKALDGDKIGFDDASRVHEALREARVVAKEEQPLGVRVEAADRVPVAIVAGQKLKDGGEAALSNPRNNGPAGLVQREDPRQAQIPPSGRNAVS